MEDVLEMAMEAAAEVAATVENEEGETVEAEAATEEPKPDEPEKKPDDVEKTETEEEWDEARVKEERQKLETLQATLAEDKRKSDANWKQIREREAKAKRAHSQRELEYQRYEASKREHDDDLKGLLQGDSRTILSKLSKLTGRDGLEVYREIGEALATDGKSARDRKPEPPKVDEEARARMELLEAEANARREQENNAILLRQVHSTLTTEVGDAERYPELAKYSETLAEEAKQEGRTINGKAAAAFELLRRMQEVKAREGRDVTVDDICAIAEHRLRLKASKNPPVPANGVPKNGAEAGPGPTPGAVQAEGGTALPGASLSPSAATQNSGARRPATEEERDREAVKHLDALFPGLM
jgi:hypothetical protein